MYAHLHLHTEYSLLDGACRIAPLMERLKELGMTSCAVTDHGVMYGVVDFYRAAKAAGILPVIGCEVYVCPDMDNKTSVTRDCPGWCRRASYGATTTARGWTISCWSSTPRG